MSLLGDLTIKDLHDKFCELKQPFQTDSKENVIDYNWHVDSILKNSQSYNKEGKKEKDKKPGASKGEDEAMGEQNLIPGGKAIFISDEYVINQGIPQ